MGDTNFTNRHEGDRSGVGLKLMKLTFLTSAPAEHGIRTRRTRTEKENIPFIKAGGWPSGRGELLLIFS